MGKCVSQAATLQRDDGEGEGVQAAKSFCMNAKDCWIK